MSDDIKKLYGWAHVRPEMAVHIVEPPPLTIWQKIFQTIGQILSLWPFALWLMAVFFWVEHAPPGAQLPIVIPVFVGR